MIKAPSKRPPNGRGIPRESCGKRRRSTSNRSCWTRIPTVIACWGRGETQLRGSCVDISPFFANGCIPSGARSWRDRCFSCGSPRPGTISRRRSGAPTMTRRWTRAWRRSPPVRVEFDDFANTHGGNGKARPPRGEALAASQGQARIGGARKRKPRSLWRRLVAFAFGARTR